MLIFIFHTGTRSCIPNKRFTCLAIVKSQDTCFFATAIMRRSIRALPHSNWSMLLHNLSLAVGQKLESGTAFFWYKAVWFQSSSLHTTSHISENFRAGNTLLAWSCRCLTLENSVFTQSERKYLFGCDFLDAISACWPDVCLVSPPHEQYSATCMLIQPVVKPSTYTTHSSTALYIPSFLGWWLLLFELSVPWSLIALCSWFKWRVVVTPTTFSNWQHHKMCIFSTQASHCVYVPQNCSAGHSPRTASLLRHTHLFPKNF